MGEHDALMGGEESGGFGVSAHLRNKDGVLVALLAAAAAEKPWTTASTRCWPNTARFTRAASASTAGRPENRCAGRTRSRPPETVAGEGVADVSTVDGFKMTLADGTWVLVRPSGTEPKLRVYAEAGSEARVDELLDAGRDVVEPLV